MKISEKIPGKMNERIIALLIVLVTAGYLLATSAVAQSSVTSNNGAQVAYDPDYLSYGDMYGFTESVYNSSNYSLTNTQQTVSLYSSTAANTSTAANYTFYQYYGTVTTGNHSNVTNGVELKNHAYSEYHSGYTKAEVPAVVEGETVPVLTTEGTGVYTLVPGSTGSYRIYVYSETDPSGKVFYDLIDSYTRANAYNGSPSQALTFTRVAESNYWYASVEVEKLSWTAYSLTAVKSTSTGTKSTSDTNGATTYTGKQGTNTTLNDDAYYYNIWTATEIKYDTLLSIRWNSGISLGPVTKRTDTITINNTDPDMGSLTAVNAFGETVAVGSAVTTVHAPIYITATPASEEYVFSGFGSAELSLVNLELGIYKYRFESQTSLSGNWLAKEALPTVAISGDYSGTMDFFAATSATASVVSGTESSYTLTVDYTGAVDTESVSYVVASAGETLQSGTITETDNVIQISAQWDTVTVSLTATGVSGNSYTAVFTVNTSNAGLVDVAKIGTIKYQFVEDALAAAKSGDTIEIISSKVSFVSADKVASKWTADTNNDGLPDGYTVKSGVTLILPYSSTGNTSLKKSSDDYPYSLYTESATNATALATSESYEYRKLIVPANKTLYVNGVMATGGTVSSYSGVAGGTNGSASETYSVLEINGEVEVRDGGIVSSCGYIYGSGNLNAKSGSKLYQPMVIMDFRGGGYTVGAAGKTYAVGTQSGESYVTPFTRYVTQNIQSGVRMEEGAIMYGYCDLYTASTGGHNRTTGVLVGSSSKNVDGLIKLNTGAVLTTAYDKNDVVSTYDRVGHLDVTIEGGGSFGTLSLTAMGQSIVTNELTFPVPYNYGFHLNGENSTYTIGYSMALLPGATLEVGEGAVLNVGNSSAGFRFIAYDGLYDHTSTGGTSSPNTVTYGKQPSGGAYPTTSALQAAGKSGTSDLIVNGTLNINSGVNFGGVVQAGGESAKLVMNASAKPNCKVQTGLIGDKSIIMNHYYFAGATIRDLKAQVIDRGTGRRTDIVAGMTYNGSEGSDIIPDYTYDLYTTSANKTPETHTESLNATIEGSWYNYTATVHMVNPENTSEILSTSTMYFCHGADVSDYYLDQACTQPASTVTQDNMVLYTNHIEARVEWTDGSAATYYPSLRSAVKDAVHTGDKVYQMCDIADLDSSISIDKTQDITIDLGTYNLAYSSTPFINAGKLALKLGSGSITNLTEKTASSAVVNNALASLTIDCTDGGKIEVTAPEGQNSQMAALMNYGTLTIAGRNDGTDGGIYCKAPRTVSMNLTSTADNAAVAVPAELTTSTVAYFGVYNTGTIAEISGGTISSPMYGIYNGNGTVTVTNMTQMNAAMSGNDAVIAQISGGTIEGGWHGLYNVAASVGSISNAVIRSKGTMVVSDASTSYVGLYNLAGTVGDITSTVIESDAYTTEHFGLTNTATKYSNTVYGIYNESKAFTPNANTMHTAYTSRMGSITDCTIKAVGTLLNGLAKDNRGYGIYNLGCTIPAITGGSIEGKWGIRNINLRGQVAQTAAFPKYCEYAVISEAHIGTIQDTQVTAQYQYALYNDGMVDEITGTASFTAGNSVTTAHAVYNSRNWYQGNWYRRYDDVVGTDGNVTRTYVADNGWEKLPTIGTISGSVTITANNGTANAGNGYALSNYGVINEIKDNVQITSQVGNGTAATSQYGLVNNGYIKRISGDVSISASGDNALRNNTDLRVIRQENTYNNTSAASGTILHQVNQYGNPATIDEIAGDTSGSGITITSTNGNYALSNYGDIGSITGKVAISGKAYVLNNALWGTRSNKTYELTYDLNAQKKTKNYTYQGGTIGTIGGSGSEVLIDASGQYAIYNQGTIQEIIDGTELHAAGNYAVRNADGGFAEACYTLTDEGENPNVSGRYMTLESRGCTYDAPYIGSITGDVTIYSDSNYGLSNSGIIDRIGDGATIYAKQYGLVNNTGYYAQAGSKDGYARKSMRILYGTAVLGESSALGEQTYEYYREQAYIKTIDGAVVYTTGSSYALQNSGVIDEIVNSEITSKTERALSNSDRSEQHKKVDLTKLNADGSESLMGLGTLNANGGYTATPIKDYVINYVQPKIVTLGAGNTITSGTQYPVFNAGRIDTIDGGGTTTITASSSIGLYNYQGMYQTTTRAADSTVTAGYKDTNAEPLPASIGKIGNVKITAPGDAIRNGDTNAIYAGVSIDELGEGLEATSNTSYGIWIRKNSVVNTVTGGAYKSNANKEGFCQEEAETGIVTPLTTGFYLGNPTGTTNSMAMNTNAKNEIAEGYKLSGQTYGELVDPTSPYADYYFIDRFFTVTFHQTNVDGSENMMTEIARLEDGADSGTVILPELIIPEEKAGWTTTFKGWCTKDASGKYTVVTTDQEGSLSVSGDMELYAVFEEKKNNYTITLNTGSGTLADSDLTENGGLWTQAEGSNVYTMTYDIESEAITLPQAIHGKFDFLGWTYEETEGVDAPEGTAEGVMGSVEIPAGTIGDLIYTAAYSGPEVNYYLDETSLIPLVTDSDASGTFTVPADDDFTALGEAFAVPEGMSLDGWRDENGTVYTAGQTYSRLDDLALYANWKANEYMVTLYTNAEGAGESTAITDANGKEIADGTVLTASYGQTLGEALPELRSAGYMFCGWQDENGDTVSRETVMGAGDMVLTAVWEVQPDGIPVVSAQDKSMPYGTEGTTLDVILDENAEGTYTYQWFTWDGTSMMSEEETVSDETDAEEPDVSDELPADAPALDDESTEPQTPVSDTAAKTSRMITASATGNVSKELVARAALMAIRNPEARMSFLTAVMPAPENEPDAQTGEIEEAVTGTEDSGTIEEEETIPEETDTEVEDDNAAGTETTVEPSGDTAVSDQSDVTDASSATDSGAAADGESGNVDNADTPSEKNEDMPLEAVGEQPAEEEPNDSTEVVLEEVFDAPAVEAEPASERAAALDGTEIDSSKEPSAAASSYEVPSTTPVGEYWYFCRITDTTTNAVTDVKVKLTVTPLKVTKAAASVLEEQKYGSLLGGIDLSDPSTVLTTGFTAQNGTPVSLEGVYAWETPETELLRTGVYNLIFTPNDTENYDYRSLKGWNEAEKTLTIAASVKVQGVHTIYVPYAEDENITDANGNGMKYYVITDETGDEQPSGILEGYSSFAFSDGGNIYAAVAKNEADARTMLGITDTASALGSSKEVYMIPVPEGDSGKFLIKAEAGNESFFDYAGLTEEEWKLSEDNILEKAGDTITYDGNTAAFTASNLSENIWMAFGGIRDSRAAYTVTAEGQTTSYSDFMEALDYANRTADAVLTVPAGRGISGNVNLNRKTALVIEKGASVSEDTSVILLGDAVMKTGEGITLRPVGNYSETEEGTYSVYRADPQLAIEAATLTIGDQVSINYAVKSTNAPASGLVYTTVGSSMDSTAEAGAREKLFSALRLGSLSESGVDTSTSLSTAVIEDYTVLKTKGVRPTQMGQTMYTTAYAGTDSSLSYSQVAGYSVKQYAQNMLSGSSNTFLKNLLSAMLRYGAAAEYQFDAGKAEALATANVTGMTAVGDTSIAPDENMPKDESGSEYATSLGADLEIALALDESVNFAIRNADGSTDGITDVRIELYDPNDGGSYVPVSARLQDGIWIGGAVPPRNYDNWYRITVTKNGTDYTAVYSVFTYLQNANGKVSQDLINAMAEYCHAAEDYQKAYDTAH